MTKVVNYHNKHVASKKDQANQILYNCQNHNNYSLDNKCLTSKIVYSTEIITDNRQPLKVSLASSETEFKARFDIKCFSKIGKMEKVKHSQSRSKAD